MTRKHTKRRRPISVSLNPFAHARDHATLLTAKEQALPLGVLKASTDRLRTGQASADDFAIVIGALRMAVTIQRQGVVRFIDGHLDDIARDLAALEERAMATGQWKAPTLYFAELEAIALLADLHAIQLRSLTYGEFRRAVATTMAQARTEGRQAVLHVEAAT